MSLRNRFFPCLLVSAAASACGGSSSETPPPLEPLPVNLHYDRSSTALAGEVPAAEADAGAEVVRSSELSEEEKPLPPARSTWGAERAVPPAPLK